MDTERPTTARISFLVLLSPEEPGQLTGIVERIQTGEKRRFGSAEEMCRMIEQMIGEKP